MPVADHNQINIRHQFDPISGVLYISIVDVIENLNLSLDPQNYWKVLKNRLKKGNSELVTKCNQLKMRASDGKNYQTDVTDQDTMLLLIQKIAPQQISNFRKTFRDLEQNSPSYHPENISKNIELSTPNTNEYELGIDFFEKENDYLIIAMLAGVNKDDIAIIATCKNILIKAERKAKNTSDPEYIIEELSWGKFSREVNFLEEIEIDSIETNFTYGMLEIKVEKIDKSKTKIIKIK